MLGIVVILFVSWLLLKSIGGKNLLVLGFTPVIKRGFQFVFGFVVMGLLFLLTVATDTWLMDIEWVRNPDANLMTFGHAFWYYLKSVVTEDLVFRGALLYLLMTRFVPMAGMLISAAAFGIYHWFSYGMLGGELQVISLIYVFVVTGFIGFSWAFAFQKTGSIMMPMGLHLGWNLTQSLFIPNNPYGELLFQKVTQVGMPEWSYLVYIFAKAFILPVVVMLVVHLLYGKSSESWLIKEEK